MKDIQDKDPAIVCAFELAMLDFEEGLTHVAARGYRSKYERVYKRLKKAGKWTAEWLLEQFALVACRMSRLPAATRGLIGVIGDRAMDIDTGSLNAAQERLKAIKNEQIQDTMEG